jgi:hypothetical protein
MVDVVLTTDDLVVLGGPSSVTVKTDFGPTGDRGSLMFVNSGSPDISGNVPQTPKILDTYINILPTDPNGEYLTMYQYQLVNGVNTWVPLVKLGPDMYVDRIPGVQFGSGSAQTIAIPISSITKQTGLTAANFSVQCSIESSLGPVSVSALPSSISSGNINIDIKAAVFASSSWSALDGSHTVNLTITVV